jgi:predicted nuclease of predicted toxin-antitoxin system
LKIVIDEDVPRELTAQFAKDGHEAVHIEELGWKGITNGDLLRRISGKYDVLVTGDSNMPNQQNLALFDVAIVQLRPRLKVIDQFASYDPQGARGDPSSSKARRDADRAGLKSERPAGLDPSHWGLP